MRERLDLTPEEREDCIKDYTDEYKNSSGTVFYEALYIAKLAKLGLDKDEIDYLVRLNSPAP